MRLDGEKKILESENKTNVMNGNHTIQLHLFHEFAFDFKHSDIAYVIYTCT